jgi:aminodeoxyfutalosine deaminase
MTDADIIRAMPKAEVHLHLEGTISSATLWSLAARNRVELPVTSLEELRGLYEFEDFGKFIKVWLLMCSCLKAEADYVGMVEGYLAECRRQNVRYTEAHFTPYNHERFGIGAARSLDVVTKRLMEAEAAGGPVTRLILDIPSEARDEAGEFTASFLEGLSNPLVVAIGLGGPEAGYPRSPFAPYFARARRAGYPAVAHAGETGGAEHVRQAVLELGARRIQHGVHAADDESILALLAERGVCCDIALTSNECLTSFTDLKSHPIRRMLEAGVPLTLSTDDPPFFGTDLEREYNRALEEVGLDMRQLWEMNLNGLRYGLADLALRRRLMLEFEEAGRALGIRRDR